MRLKSLLHFAEDRMLVEQLRLSLKNYKTIYIPVSLLAVLLFVTLCNERNVLGMSAWFVTIELSNLACFNFAGRYLASDIPAGQARRMVWKLMSLHGLNGLLWGALPWVTLDTSTTGGSVLAMSATAAIAGGAASTLSPVIQIYMAMVSSEVIMVATKLWLMGDPAYDVLAVAGVLYVLALIAQARNNHLATRDAVGLRFENAGLVAQLREKTEIAEAARREAERANAAKSRFLAAASHDLRQPVHAQGLFLEVLADTPLDSRQQELLTNIRASADASSEMLNSLLDFSRVETGGMEPKRQVFQLQPIFNKIEREFAPQAEAKGLVYRTRETDLQVHSDPSLIELVLRNLVSNAIRYTERGGVLVACRCKHNEAVLEVWDTGIGIAASQKREIFREFHQLGNPERDRRKGLGLGLAIVQGLARKLGHVLSLNSVPGRGSVFRLGLPIVTEATSTLDSQALKSKPADLRGLQVLVIDDDEAVRAGMALLLRCWGCVVNVAETIQQGLEVARRQAPDLVVSDYRLREQQSGLDAILALRVLIGNHLPALLITGDTAPERLREALASDIPLLHKPVSPELLRSGMQRVLHKSGSRQMLQSS